MPLDRLILLVQHLINVWGGVLYEDGSTNLFNGACLIAAWGC